MRRKREICGIPEVKWSGREDLNLRPLGPEGSVSTVLDVHALQARTAQRAGTSRCALGSVRIPTRFPRGLIATRISARTYCGEACTHVCCLELYFYPM